MLSTDHLYATRERVAQARFEAFQAWEYHRLLTNELTDQSERLAAPMQNSFEYVLTDRGLAVEQITQTEQGEVKTYQHVRDVLEKGLQRAEEQVLLHPEWYFELNRRRLELQEWQEIEAFAAGEHPEAYGLQVFSPHPDALQDDDIVIDGYNRGRKRTMSRTIIRTENGVRITSMSLDQTNYLALQESVAAVGYTLDADKSSEEILAQRYWITSPPPEGFEWTDVVRRAYDLSLAEQFGGEWYAGRRPMSADDALAFILRHPGPIEQHMRVVQEVMSSVHDAIEQAKLLEHHRYNFAAALGDLLQGKSAASNADAGAGAREQGRSFDPECPTLGSVAEQVQALGYGEVPASVRFAARKLWLTPVPRALFAQSVRLR